MKIQYLIEIKQTQLIFISVEAESSSEAIERALNQEGEVSPSFPPEVEQINARILRGSYGEQ